MATRPASAGVPQNGRVLGAGCWGTHKHPQPRPRYFGQRLGCCHAGLSVLLVCIPACQHANNWGCWHAGVHANSTDMPAFFAPSLAGWPSTSMPTCQHANNWGCWHAGVHPSSTDRPAFLPPSLAGWPSTSMPACQQLGCWHARVHASSTDTPAFLAPSWSAGR